MTPEEMRSVRETWQAIDRIDVASIWLIAAEICERLDTISNQLGNDD